MDLVTFICFSVLLYIIICLLGCRVTLFGGLQKNINCIKNHGIDKLSLSEIIAGYCPTLSNTRSIYSPHFFLLNGHFQTIYSGLFTKIFKNQIEYIRELVDTPDGGVISLDWTEKPGLSDKTTFYIFIMHGLTGGSHESYVQDLIIESKKYGYKCVVMNFRGCSETPVKTPQLYCGSFTSDVDVAVKHIIKTDHNAKIFGVGFSLGANILTKYVGQQGQNSLLVGLVSIGNPYDLLGTYRAVERTIIGRNLYIPRMGYNLLKVIRRHTSAFINTSWFDLKELEKTKTVLEYDEVTTRRCFGYKTVHEYYRFGSCVIDIPYIDIPTLFLTALDDPIAVAEVIPYFEIKANPNTILATTEKGGHLGWFVATPGYILPHKRWFPKPVMEFVDAIIKTRPPIQVSLNKESITGTPWYSMPNESIAARKNEVNSRNTSAAIETDNSGAIVAKSDRTRGWLRFLSANLRFEHLVAFYYLIKYLKR